MRGQKITKEDEALKREIEAKESSIDGHGLMITGCKTDIKYFLKRIKEKKEEIEQEKQSIEDCNLIIDALTDKLYNKTIK